MILTVKLFCGNRQQERNVSKLESSLINYEHVDLTLDQKATFDDVLHRCAVLCGITPIYFPLFALWDPGNESWVKLSSNLDSSGIQLGSALNSDRLTKCLEFRIRFLLRSELQIGGEKRVVRRWSLPGDSPKSFLSDSVTSYLFRQRREDFLQDRIQLHVEPENAKESEKDREDSLIAATLGVAVLDMICLARENNTDIRVISQKVKFKSLLPRSYRERLSSPQMNYCNRRRIKTKFNHYLKYFSSTAERWQSMGHSISYFQKRYLLNLELLSLSYGTERYSLTKEGSISVSADSGIVLHGNEDSEYSEKWCDFSELTDMNLQVRQNTGSDSTMCVVSLSKLNGSVRKFALKSVASAVDLASCIDGFYRLLVDSHHYLCREVSSPSLVQQFQLGCHGPITFGFAEKILRERETKHVAQVGDCIIRQSQESYSEYFVNTICHLTPLTIKNFKLDCDTNGKLGLYGLDISHKHGDLGDLMDACRGGKYNGDLIPFNTTQIVFPQHKLKSNLIARLCSDQSEDADQNGNSMNVLPRMAIFMLKNYSPIKNLGYGAYTSVMKYSRRDKENQYVVIKSVFDLNEKRDLGQKDHVDKSFQDSMTMLNCLKHEHIIQHMGMTLKNMVMLEYVQEQSITTYLQRNHGDPNAWHPTEWGTWFLQVLWQMTHACNYLEDLGFCHGNLCGKNILLREAMPQPHIKLADPGVKTRCSTANDRRGVVEPILTAPWVAWEFCYIYRNPMDLEYPSIEGDKWSFATTVCEILNWGRIGMEPANAYELTGEIINCYDSGEVLPIPELINANEELSQLIRQCWNKQRDKRPSFQKILRELGSTLSSDYILPAVTPNYPQGAQSRSSYDVCDSIIEHDLPTYEDEKLTYHSCLGEGHFGSVDLFIYDQYRNGRSEYVAVKSLKRSSNKPQSIIDFKNEIETMRKLNHKYVVKLLGISLPSGRIVMEYLKNGSLAGYLRERKGNGRALHKNLLRWSSQIAQGMLALQSKRLIHRDLALRNILLAKDSPSPQSPLYIKISDFGLSRILKEDTDFYLGNLEEFPAQWYAPECLCDDIKKAFRFESDIWSFGVTIWEMFSCGEKPTYPPLPAITEMRLLIRLKEHLRNGHRLKRTVDCPSTVYSLMHRCWEYEPTRRISFEELKEEFDSLLPNADQLV